jgi:hypothetical protein
MRSDQDQVPDRPQTRGALDLATGEFFDCTLHARLASIVLEEFFVGSRPLKVDFLSGRGVDQHPVGFNVGVSVSGPIEFEGMVFHVEMKPA